MNRKICLAVVGFCFVLCVSAANGMVEESDTWSNWQSELLKDHPLTGKIWSPSGNRFVTTGELVSELGSRPYVLIGETHDNPDHHRLQGWIIDQIAEPEFRAVVMEMVPEDRQEDLDAYLASSGRTGAGLGSAIGWEESGWPDWSIYQPIGDAIVRRGLSVQAGDAGREVLQNIRRGGLASLGQDRLSALGLNGGLPSELLTALSEDLVEAHCNLMPIEAMAPMAEIQIFRDAFMAEAMVRAGRAILIAGNGHVRLDRAVPFYLDRFGKSEVSVVAMLVEVQVGLDDPQEYSVATSANGPVADFVWFTPRLDRPDPCEMLKKHLQK